MPSNGRQGHGGQQGTKGRAIGPLYFSILPPTLGTTLDTAPRLWQTRSPAFTHRGLRGLSFLRGLLVPAAIVRRQAVAVSTDECEIFKLVVPVVPIEVMKF